MLGELPKLLGRNFAIGFYLPTSILLAGTYWLELQFDYLPEWIEKALLAERSWLGAGLVLAITWLLALFLLGMNRTIVRLMEGYGPLNRDWNPLKKSELKKFHAMEKKIHTLRAQRKTTKDTKELARLKAELTPLTARRNRRFPHSERYVLPTAFGNTMRAYETYSYVMYGVEATEIWNRLLLVMSNEARALIAEARAHMNFAVNLWFVGSLLLLGYFPLAGWATATRGQPFFTLQGVLFLITFLALATFSSNNSRRLAALLGLRIKASFDVFLPELRKKLVLSSEGTRAEQKAAWLSTSAAMLLHNSKYLPQGKSEEEQEEGPAPDPLWLVAIERIVVGFLRARIR